MLANKRIDRKSKKEQVKKLLEQYPKASNTELQRLSGMSRITIIKWKKIL